MLQFSELTLNLDATPRPVGTVTIPTEVARPMVRDLRRLLLAHDDGRAFAVDVSFTQGRPAELAMQRVGGTACVAQWLRHGQLLAVTLILSGLDDDDDGAALATARDGWGCRCPRSTGTRSGTASGR
jgi:hypothetical protein